MILTEFQTQLLSLTLTGLTQQHYRWGQPQGDCPYKTLYVSALRKSCLIEKAEVIQALTQTLSNGSRGITKTSGVMNTMLPVWLFVSLRRQGATDAEILQLYPHLTAADLLNIWVYAEAYSEEIEQVLKEQEE